MGIALILIGLLSAGVVVDFIVENDLTGAQDRSFALFGGSFSLNQTEIVLGAAVLGGFAVLFVVLGLALFRDSWGRRREFKHRVSELERENAELRSKPGVLTVPELRPDNIAADRETAAETDREHARHP